MKTILCTICIFLALLSAKSQEVYSLKGVQDVGIHFEAIEEVHSNQQLPSATESLTKGMFRNSILDAPDSKLMAAMAYDANSNSIIYMPMISSYVYIQKVGSQQLTVVDGLNEIHVAACNQGSQFTRMTMAADGFAYAMNNDFSELIQINPNTQQINNLGSIQFQGEHPSESKMIWGGDMVADTQNNLYVISAYGNVYQVNLKKMNATSMGQLKGMPEDFTTNGAAVLQDGRILVSNAKGEGMYTFTLDDLELKRYYQSSHPSYDLASRYFVPVSVVSDEEIIQKGILLYPTIVSQKEIHLSSEMARRNVSVQVFDTNSYMVAEFQHLNLEENQEITLPLKKLSPNIYIIKILDMNGQIISSQKVTVSR